MKSSPIKVLVVDDSAFVRKVVRELLASSQGIELVGSARNGEDALAMTETLRPDVVTCDLIMPGMDGVDFVKTQMRRRPVPIIILSASSQEAALVIEALEAGAVDFVQKPTALAVDHLRSVGGQLIEKIKLASEAMSQNVVALAKTPIEARTVPASATRVDIVVLGISTGGPQALRFLIPQLPADFPVPLVMVLHMPIGYTALYAEKLAEISSLPVREAFEGCVVHAREALLAPAGKHLSFRRNAAGSVQVQLSNLPSDKPHRPSVDVLFQSAAQVYGSRVLAIVMTGMGDDGKEGAAWVKAQGGMVLTEAEDSCIIFGMPRSVVEAGLSDAEISLPKMAEEIRKRL